MSASLVGSEMCIRDRQFGAREQPNPALGSNAIRSSGALQSGARGHLKGTCLLYTSDAADDM
eukprot:2292973-Alexandrium_andersonii.AAC.1